MSRFTSLILVALAVPALGQTGSETRLFDGGSLNGWEGDRAVWRVVDGAIVGGTLERPIRESDYLCTTTEFDDFELRLSARIKGGRNAGVHFRSQRVPNSNEVGGYQADMGFTSAETISRLSDTIPDDRERPYPLWGSLLDEFRPEGSRYPDPAQPYRLLAVAPRGTVERAFRPDDWNEVVVFAIGPRIRLELNGVTTVQFVEKGKVPVGGRVCLQVHSGPPSEAWYKDISIRPVAASGR